MFTNLIGEVKGIFNKITIFELIISIIYILLGLIFFTSPKTADVIVSIFTGLVLLLSGCASIYSYLKRGDIVLFNNNLFYGIAFIILGLIAMIFKKILIIMLGIYFLVIGVQKINYGIVLKKFSETSWLFNIVVGLFIVVIAIISFFTQNGELVEAVGLCLLFYGGMNLVETLMMRKRSKYFLK